MSAARIPIVLLTGFLGTGKTTLLSRLLAHPELSDTAVLINELGEIGLDHQLVFGEGGAETGDAAAGLRAALVLANGCVCCTVRDDLAVALDDLFVRREQGGLPPFSRVIIETTGLAYPVPIIESLRASPVAAEHFRLAQVLCTVDAAVPLDRLEQRPESLAQVVVADCLLITRTDLADEQAIVSLETRLARLNPQARMRRIVMGEGSPGELFGEGRDGDEEAAFRDERLVSSRSAAAGSALTPPRRAAGIGPIASLGRIGPLFHDNVRTQTLRFAGPSVWGDVSAMIADMAAGSGHTLLRIKGVLRLEGYPEPMVVQLAGGRVSPIEPLPGALAEGDAGYLVIISAEPERQT